MSNLRADVIGSEETLVSIAERDKLSIARECIELRRLKDGRPPGTKLVVDLDSDNNLTVEAARQYLHPYVRFLPVPILLNGTLISQQSIHGALRSDRGALWRCPPCRLRQACTRRSWSRSLTPRARCS